MRNKELWYSKIREKVIRRKFPPRLAQVLLELDLPTIDNPEKSRYVYGDIDTGKTVYAAQLLLLFECQQYLLGVPYRTEFITANDLLTKIRSTYQKNATDTEQDIFSKYGEATLLVLDDLGVEKSTDWVYQVLYTIINYRYEHLLPTIITSNLSLDELANKLDDDRIPSRISRMGVITKKKPYAH